MTTAFTEPPATAPDIAAVVDALGLGGDAIHIDHADLAEADCGLIPSLAAARANAARADTAFWHHGACDA